MSRRDSSSLLDKSILRSANSESAASAFRLVERILDSVPGPYHHYGCDNYLSYIRCDRKVLHSEFWIN